MKTKFLFLLAALLIVLAALPFFRSQPKKIDWVTDAKIAFEKAEESERPVLTFLFTDWCTYCRQMDESTFTDTKVLSQLADEFVWLRLNPEKSEQGALLRQRFGVSGYPTILFFNPEGQELDRLQGFLPPEHFVEAVNGAISSADSLPVLREELEENPEDPSIHYRIGEKLMGQRKYSRAALFFEKAVEFDPENQTGNLPASLYYLAEAQMYLGEKEHAVDTLEELRRSFPESDYAAEADLMEAEILLSQGERSKAELLLAQFLDDNPSHQSADKIRQFLEQ